MDLGLQGRAAVVAGGSRGVGRATAGLLAREGCRVAVLAAHAERPARDRGRAARRSAPRTPSASSATCSTPARSKPRSRSSTSGGASCHVLVNTVGPAHVGGIDDLTDDTWHEEFDLGVLTMIRTTRAALPLLRKATFARIVNVAASSIRHQSPGLIGFTAAKAAMASASKNLSRALAPEGIIVNTVAPGTVMSPDARLVPRRHRPRRTPRGPARGRLRGHRPRLRRVERHRPRRAPRGGRARGASSSARRSAASSSARPSRSTAVPTSSDRLLLSFSGFVRSARGYLRRRWSTTSPTCGKPSPTSIPTREALICGERRLTLRRDRGTREPARPPPRRRTASARDDHVALLLYNGTEYLEGMLAACKLRAVPINVNYRYMEEELRYLLDDCDAKAIVFHREFAPKLAAIRERAARSSTHLRRRSTTPRDATEPRATRRGRLRRRARRRVTRARLRAALRATTSTSSTPAAPPGTRRV